MMAISFKRVPFPKEVILMGIRWYVAYPLSAHHIEELEAALKFLKKATRRTGLSKTSTIDGSDANEAAIKRYNEEHGTALVIRQVQYLNNIVEQGQIAVKRITRPMLGFQVFEAAQSTLASVEIMPMTKSPR